MMPQSNSENEPALFHPPMLMPLGNNPGNTLWSSSSNNYNSSSSGSSPRNNNEDSPIDDLHPPMALQDEESLFSAYLHHPMALLRRSEVVAFKSESLTIDTAQLAGCGEGTTFDAAFSRSGPALPR